MKKLIIIILSILLCTSTAYAGAKFSGAKLSGVKATGGAAASCPSGTYLAYWDANHSSGFTYICYNSGAGNVAASADTQDSAADAAIYNAANEHLKWTDANVMPNDEIGTICATVTITDDGDTNMEENQIFEVYGGSGNLIYCKVWDTQDKVLCSHTGNSEPSDSILSATVLSFDTAYRVCYAWDASQSTADHKISVVTKGSATSYGAAEDDLTAFAAGSQPSRLTIGEDLAGNQVNDTVRIEDFVVLSDFGGTDPNP